MNARRRRLAGVAAAALVVAGLLVAAPVTAVAATEVTDADGSERVTDDGARVDVPAEWPEGQGLAVRGDGWVTATGQGSLVTVRLDGATADAPVIDPTTGAEIADPTVHAVVLAGPAGEWSVVVDRPASWPAGTTGVVHVESGSAPGDVARSVVAEVAVAGPPPAPSDEAALPPGAPAVDPAPVAEAVAPPAVPAEDAEPVEPVGPSAQAPVAAAAEEGCTTAPADYSFVLAGGVADPQVPVDGSVRLSGEGWCNLVGGGSLIAVKFDLGGYWAASTHVAPLFDGNVGEVVGTCPATVCATNASIWFVIEAAADGTFEVDIPLPTGDDGPPLAAGEHTLQLLTRTVSADPYYEGARPDPSRSVSTSTFTVVTPDPDAAPEVTTQPADARGVAGQTASFFARASGTPTPTVQWESSLDGTTWAPLAGADTTTLTLSGLDQAQSGSRYRAVFTNRAGRAVSAAATLTVTEPTGPEPTDNVQARCGVAYGPRAADVGEEFCFEGPLKVVVGTDIVIRGTGGYLATDDATGSVVNFFLDAEYSGDPRTLFTRRTITHPVTGAVIGDTRSHAVVQAHGDGTWEVRIPFPTDANSHTTPEQDVAALWAPGTQHSVRMLSGSLLTAPLDRQRGASLYVTVVRDLDDEVEVAEPVYPHQTFASAAPGDAAVAWLQQNADSGGSVGLTGTGWLAKEHQRGSAVVVRLLDEDGVPYRRSGSAGDDHADPTDPTVWQVVAAGADGTLRADVALPDGVVGGDHVAVEVTTADDGSPTGDVGRRWTSAPLTIDGLPYVPTPGGGATCTAGQREYTYELAPGMAVPAANVGGTIRLRGEKWCNLVGGGSLIAVKINAGGYSHLPTATAAHFDANVGRETGPSPSTIAQTNKTIWYVIEADARGRFDVEIPLPTRTGSTPTFGEGSYTLQLLTRTISADPYYAGSRPDPSRSIQTPEFTVVGEGEPLDGVEPGRPTAEPEPLHATEDLVGAARGGVTIDQQATRWVVSVPAADPGDWVYLNVYDGTSPRFPWRTTWFQVAADGKVRAPLAGTTLPVGTNKVSVQDRDGALLGWAQVTVREADDGRGTATPRPVPPASGGQGAAGGPSGGGSSNRSSSPSPSAGRSPAPAAGSAPGAVAAAAARPTTEPGPPVATYHDLVGDNVGEVQALAQDDAVVVTLPDVVAGGWVYLHLYTEAGAIVPIGWVQVGSDHTVTVEVGALPPGAHKLSFVAADGRLVGWVAVDGPEVVAATPRATAAGGPEAASGRTPVVAGVAPIVPGGAGGPSLLLFAAVALLVLCAAGAGAITLASPPPRTT